MAVVIWVSILNAQSTTSYKSKIGFTETKEQEATKTEETVTKEVAKEDNNLSIDLAIETGLSILNDSNSTITDFISSSDYLQNKNSEEVETISVAMKKPVIAQNLSVSQKNSNNDVVTYIEYTFEQGDNLNTVAEKFGITTQTLISVNQIKSPTSITEGSVLTIPSIDGTLYIVKEGDSLSSIVQQYGLSISWRTLSDVNNLPSQGLIAGQKLFIPSETSEDSGILTNDSLNFINPSNNAITVGLYGSKTVNPISNDSITLEGILLQNSNESPVFASEKGQVVDKGFNDNGSIFIKILHNNGYTTYYNYLGESYVEVSDIVNSGQIIGIFKEGTTNFISPTIYFKIEQDGFTLDPYSFF